MSRWWESEYYNLCSEITSSRIVGKFFVRFDLVESILFGFVFFDAKINFKTDRIFVVGQCKSKMLVITEEPASFWLGELLYIMMPLSITWSCLVLIIQIQIQIFYWRICEIDTGDSPSADAHDWTSVGRGLLMVLHLHDS